MASAEGGEEPRLQDGSCDACEPDEAQSAAQLCLDCDFAFCRLHAEEHRQKYGGHRMTEVGPLEAEGPQKDGQEGEEEKGEGGRQVQRRMCEAHEGQELSLYCQEDQAIICVLCAVSGPHRQHLITTLHEAYEALRNKEPVDLKVAILEMVKRLKFKCADPKVTQGDMKQCIRQEFNKVRSQICEEERRALHLVDLKEALVTAHTMEILADIDVRKAKLMTEMAELTRQLNTFNELALLKPEVMDAFEQLGFPHCVGALDGTHIPVQPPRARAEEYFNRKYGHSIVLQALTSATGLFLNIEAGFSGRNHDAFIFRHSSLCQAMDEGAFVPGNPTITIREVQVPALVIADGAYPLRRWLMKPYSGALRENQLHFNIALSRARCVVERAFGRLKGRWGCLSSRLTVAENHFSTVVSACVVLHNICESRGHALHVERDTGELQLPPLPEEYRPGRDRRRHAEGEQVQAAIVAMLAEGGF